MTAPVDICNQALAESAARASIGNIGEDSPEGQAAEQFYTSVRDQVLRAARWGFARKTALLSLLKASPGTPESTVTTATTWTAAFPPPPWLYSYAKPADALTVWQVQMQPNTAISGVPLMSTASMVGQAQWGASPDRNAVRFVMAADDDETGNPQTVILTNASQALCVYTRVIEDPDNWDPLFRDAVVQALAGKFAMAVSGDKEVVKLRMQTANNAIIAARTANANETVTTLERDADWISARNTVPLLAPMGMFWAPYGPLFSVV